MEFDEATTSWVILFARLALATVFLVSGIHKLFCYDKAIVEFRNNNVPALGFFLPATIALHLAGGVAIVLGFYAREAAFILAIFTIVATLKVHCFWRMDGAERLSSSRVALAHLAVVGGLLLLMVTGPGRLALF
jgi:putative oxidoreductase